LTNYQAFKCADEFVEPVDVNFGYLIQFVMHETISSVISITRGITLPPIPRTTFVSYLETSYSDVVPRRNYVTERHFQCSFIVLLSTAAQRCV